MTRASFLGLLVMLAAALTFHHELALADGNATVAASAAAAAPPMQFLSGYAGLALVGLALLSWGVRKFSSWSFFHSTAGAAVAGVISAVVPAAVQTIEQHGLQWQTLETAILGALLSYIASDNASNSPEEQKAKVLGMKKRAGQSSPPSPPITKVGMMLPIAFLLLTPACKTAGGAPFAACELGKLPTYQEQVIADVSSIVSSGASNWQQQLEGLGVVIGEDLVSCTVKAILAAWNTQGPTPSLGQPAPEKLAAIQRLQIYLAAHPAKACGGTFLL